MLIDIKLNVWLWFLCGRSDGFQSDILNTGVTYGTPQAASDVEEARNLLRLDDDRTDFHVIGAMAAAMELAQVLRILPENHNTVFDPAFYHAPVSVSVVGAVAVSPAPGRWPSLRNFPSELPAATSHTITRRGTLVDVTSDVGTSERYDYQTFGDTILIPGLRAMGVDAAFTVPRWDDGDSFTISVPPTRYPFASVASAITSPTLIALMARAGTLETFATTADPVRKVGALACAIMLAQYRAAVSTLTVSVFAVKCDATADTTNAVNNQLTAYACPVFLEGAPVTYDAADYIEKNQLSADGRVILLDGAPVTYDDANYDAADV